MPLFGATKRTYSKKQETNPAWNSGLCFTNQHGKENQNTINLDSSFEESFWKDSFDKLLDDKK